MDDLELEARLRTHLHRRLDDAPIPGGLVSNVSQALATAARPIGLATRTGRIRLGWAAVAAAVILAVAAIGIGKGLGPTGPGAIATPTPPATTAPERWFVVLPPPGTDFNKPVASVAGDVLSARIRALGIGNFTSAAGYGIEFLLPAGGPSDASIRAVLGANGELRIVPLPVSDYGPGMRTATLGKPLPKDEPALIGWDGIASVASDPLGGSPDITITLKPAAAQAFGDYTGAHIGETFAIVLDGRVVLLPIVMDPVTSGQIKITPGSGDTFAETAAILAGGELPVAWRGATVPEIITSDQAIAAALTATRGGNVQDASPTVDRGPLAGSLRAVWVVDVHQPDCPDNASCVSADLLVVIDAVTGTVISVGPQGS
jgi:hypothetical protein